MIKTYIIKCGKDIQVFISGTNREQVEPTYWSLFNHGATSQTNPEWTEANTVTFWTQKDRLIRAFRKAAINAILNNHSEKFKGKRGALIPALADKLAARRWRHCISTAYARPVSVANLDYHSIGSISAEKPDSDYSNRENI